MASTSANSQPPLNLLSEPPPTCSIARLSMPTPIVPNPIVLQIETMLPYFLIYSSNRCG